MSDNGDRLSRRTVLKHSALATGSVIAGGVAASGTAAAGIGDGRVGHYNLNNLHLNKDTDEKIKNFVHDASPEKNHGTNKGAEVVKDGAVGKAFEFDGIDDLVEVSDDYSLNVGDNSLTVAGWINPGSGFDDFSMLAVKRNPSANYKGYELDTGSDGKARFLVDDGSGGSGRAIAVSEESLTAGTWYHVAGVRDTENQESRIYIDGEQKGGANTSNVGSTDTSVKLGIGGRPADDDYHLAGQLDEVRVYDRALSDAEITDLYEMKD